MTGPPSSAAYFESMSRFIEGTLGPKALKRFSIVINDADAVAAQSAQGVRRIAEVRAAAHEPYFFNWRLNIDLDFQQPFVATHESMAALDLGNGQSTKELAVNLRRAFSGIVAGNVREEGAKLVAEHGPFELRAEHELAAALDGLLRSFVEQRRMKLSDPEAYRPCYRIAG